MREILFRGKRLDNGKWVMGFYVHHRNVAHYILDVSYGGYEDIDGGFFVPRWYAVEPSSVGQYTGLTDKNGKKIFERDIIENIDGRAIVFFDQTPCGFYMRFLDAYDDTPLDMGEMWDETEVIGNIHDNPELMEVE